MPPATTPLASPASGCANWLLPSILCSADGLPPSEGQSWNWSSETIARTGPQVSKDRLATVPPFFAEGAATTAVCGGAAAGGAATAPTTASAFATFAAEPRAGTVLPELSSANLWTQPSMNLRRDSANLEAALCRTSEPSSLEASCRCACRASSCACSEQERLAAMARSRSPCCADVAASASLAAWPLRSARSTSARNSTHRSSNCSRATRAELSSRCSCSACCSASSAWRRAPRCRSAACSARSCACCRRLCASAS
mmetsp:Transcript_66904/g.211745  ORF Transcript_66904/g.211745 Transcript_66904/m.211745 type:complete len:257 (+) Transcript_66904:717-1487(+)